MTTEELRRAMEEPAKRGQWAFEPGLVDLILRDAGDEPGALPLLSHALLETWKRRAGHTLTLKGYADAGGVRYQEFSNLGEPLPVVAETDAITLSDPSAATDWIDGLISDRAKVIIGYDHPHFGQFPAVVSNEHGQGRITTVGTVPNPALAADLVRWLAAEHDQQWHALPPSVTVHSATNAAGECIHIVHNWSWNAAELTLPREMTDVLAEGNASMRDLELGPWDVRVLAE